MDRNRRIRKKLNSTKLQLTNWVNENITNECEQKMNDQLKTHVNQYITLE